MGSPVHPAPVEDSWLRRVRWLTAAALILLVLGVRLWLVGRYGSDLPFWDQWDAEAAGVFQPYFSGTLGLEHWFEAHNEHRIPFTRLIAFALMRADGQWDARVQMVVNAILCAGVAAALFLMVVRGAGRARTLLLGALLTALFALPYGWENTLAGFQSQFYLLIGFSLVAMYLLPSAPGLTRAWLIGAVAAVAALFCMGSGLVAALAVVGALGGAALRRRHELRRITREAAPTVALCASLAVAGVALSVEVPRHAPLRAHSLGEFAEALARYLAWPWTSTPQPLWVLGAWVPVIVFVVAYVRGRVPDGRHERFVLAASAWSVLQAAALAYSRAEGFFSSRYGDVLAFAVVVNVLAALPWLGWRTARARAATGAFGLWLAVSGAGVALIGFDGGAPRRGYEYAFQRRNVAAFVETGELSWLRPPPEARGFNVIPYPETERLARLLLDDRIRGILPGSVQRRPVLSRIQGRAGPPSLGRWKPGDAPDFWERAMRFGPEAAENARGFALEVRKVANRPVLVFYVRDAGEPRISVTTSAGGPAPVTVLGRHDDRGWRPFLARCPTARCVVAGAPGQDGTELTDPREIGWLAAAAFIVTWEAWMVIVAGALTAAAAIVAAVYGRTMTAIAQDAPAPAPDREIA